MLLQANLRREMVDRRDRWAGGHLRDQTFSGRQVKYAPVVLQKVEYDAQVKLPIPVANTEILTARLWK